MGYTHYWRKPNGTDGFADALPVIRKILKRHADIIQFEYDDDKEPVCTDELIRFNGIGEDGHETFYFTNDTEDFSFCKTARKEYDIVVCECLIVLNHFIPKLEVSSDGMSGYTSDEDNLAVGSVISDPDGAWGQAMKNVSKHYDIDYCAVCTEIYSEGKYYGWRFEMKEVAEKFYATIDSKLHELVEEFGYDKVLERLENL